MRQTRSSQPMVLEPNVITQGIYEHYKSTPEKKRLYQVLFLSRNEPDLAILVHYTPLFYDSDDNLTKNGINIWTRTLEDFTAELEYNNKTVPRFTRISSTIET